MALRDWRFNTALLSELEKNPFSSGWNPKAQVKHLLGVPLAELQTDYSRLPILVIDALDECPEPARDTALFCFLEHLRDLQTRDNIDLHVLVVSRQEPDIQARVLQNTTHSLDFGDAIQHINEINEYISSQLYSEVAKSYRGWTDYVKEEVRNVLIRKSNGM